MCGIVGWVGSPDINRVQAMISRLAHRGPDARGEWWSKDHRVWFGHTRLSILDLSESGAQPMRSDCGRYVLSFNGEVYNFPELRNRLEACGHSFRGSSDTEVMLAAFEQWGVFPAIAQFVGMFAFALHDSQEDTTYLVRDRLGVKPLSYAVVGDQLLFASEIPAILESRIVSTTIDEEALSIFFRELCVPSPISIFSSIRKLSPGSALVYRRGEVKILEYWNLEQVIYRGLRNPFQGSFGDAVDELDRLMSDSVSCRLTSDVPLGAFLSGGVDSSLVVAMMSRLASARPRTFSIGFEDPRHDESRYASKIAEYLSTEHHTMIVNQRRVIQEIPSIAGQFDEPFADSSAIPTALVARLARSYVTVALSGDGGDEFWGGYPRYSWIANFAMARRLLTPCGARGIAYTLESLPKSLWLALEQFFGRKSPGARLYERVSSSLRYLRNDIDELYQHGFSPWPPRVSPLLSDLSACAKSTPKRFDFLTPGHRMMAIDQQNFLPNDILVKVDRTSMAVGLEAREPLLDHRLVEWSWTLPFSFKVDSRCHTGKRLLRALLERYVPAALFNRPKMGFGVPLASWLREDLRSWVDQMFDEGLRRSSAPFNKALIVQSWREHLQGKDRTARIWTVLAFLGWEMNFKQRQSLLVHTPQPSLQDTVKPLCNPGRSL